MIHKYIQIISLAIIAVTFSSCFENPVENPVSNGEPDTFLFLYPDSTISQQPSRLTVSWWGDDADGLIVGFYIKWVGIDSTWNFTPSNDSTFALPIGTSDTSYTFMVAAVDDNGNGKYDASVVRNGIDFGPEPFIDANDDSVYNEGETFFDIGLVDPTPASIKFPIKNSPPTIEWNELTVLPDTSFPVMTFAWVADDLDGEESIVNINVALNDTNNFLSISGNTRLITLRTKEFDSPDPEMEILIDGSELNILPDKLPGLKFDDDNVFYIQAEDISGAKTPFIALPDSESTWYVKKPRGKLLVVDNYFVTDPINNAEVADFYANTFNSLNGGALIGKYDVLDVTNSALPFENVTFPETIKLFDYIFWYSDTKPSVDLLSIVTNSFIDGGGKIAFSVTFEDSSTAFDFDVSILQSFLPIDSLGQDKPISFIFSGTINPSVPGSGYPVLTIESTISSIRTFYPSTITAQKVYDISSSQLNGTVGFKSNDNTLFFIGIPLHQANGGDGNVASLLEKVFFEDFGFTP